MNEMVFFESTKTHDEKHIKSEKGEKLQEFSNKIEISDIINAPSNLVSKGYTELKTKQSTKGKEGKVNLYRPISPNNDDYPIYEYRSFSPRHDANNFNQGGSFVNLNNQKVVLDKFPHIFTPIVNFDQFPSIDETQNNNYRNNKNNNQGHVKTQHRTNYTSTRGNINNSNCNKGQRRKSNHHNIRQENDPISRRVHGLTCRFRARGEKLKIDTNPINLLNGGPYDQLSQAVYDVFASKAQKIETYESKILIWKDLFMYIRKCISHYALYIVGSTMTGFGLNSSDIDICLLIRSSTEDPRLDSLHQLHTIENHLLKYGVIIHSELILAKVPILKLREQSTGFEIDLNCNNSVGIYNTHLLYCYARCDWRVRPLVIMVKLWAQANGINDAKNLTVSSYSWTLLLIHFLQCGVSPAVLPCLQTLYPEHFNVDKSKITDVHEDLHYLNDFQSFNTQSLAELLIGFFGYYANFDFNQYAVSVRTGSHLLIEECKQVKAPKNDPNQWKYLCIEEPFDYTNTARSVYDIGAFRHIKSIIGKSFDELVRTKMLNSVLPVNLNPDHAIMGIY